MYLDVEIIILYVRNWLALQLIRLAMKLCLSERAEDNLMYAEWYEENLNE